MTAKLMTHILRLDMESFHKPLHSNNEWLFRKLNIRLFSLHFVLAVGNILGFLQTGVLNREGYIILSLQVNLLLVQNIIRGIVNFVIVPICVLKYILYSFMVFVVLGQTRRYVLNHVLHILAMLLALQVLLFAGVMADNPVHELLGRVRWQLAGLQLGH